MSVEIKVHEHMSSAARLKSNRVGKKYFQIQSMCAVPDCVVMFLTLPTEHGTKGDST